MLSPLTTPSAQSVDTNTPGTQWAKSATTAMEQDTTQHYAGTQDKQNTIISGPTADPTTKMHNNWQHNRRSPSRHRQSCHRSTSHPPTSYHLQEGTEKAPHLGLIRSVTLLPLYIQDQKID